MDQSDETLSRLSAAQAAARTAGRNALGFYGDRSKLTVRVKGVQDRVTEADRSIEAEIRRDLSERFPNDAFLGEEGGASENALDTDGGLWVVDPIDGTDCFIFGLPSWCVSIAWVHHGAMTVGVIYDAIHDEMFSAVHGQGAFLNGGKIQVSDATDAKDGLIGVGYSPRVDPEHMLGAFRRLTESEGMFHRCGSGALSLAWVAAGRLIGYYEPHMNAWDCLAGLLLVREAGGWTNDFLAGDGLARGNAAAAAAPGVVDHIRFISGDSPRRADPKVGAMA